MSITLTHPITITDLSGTQIVVSNVKVSDFVCDNRGQVRVNFMDSVTEAFVGFKEFRTLSAVNNIIGQIDSYVTNQGIVAGTKD